ncbi:hypothetical protein HK105_206330 [Polyrhizophydium stewartii]|uniref:Eukaryotic translation initiation factor 3 subunit F n=1 Tax=Polyrhizophydium stewartii TaxID=2732419 RepID=A0ABR4N3H3_9FUNG
MAKKRTKSPARGTAAASPATDAAPQPPAAPTPASFLQLALPSTIATSAVPAQATLSPLVLLSVLDHFVRRKVGQTQILGALLGHRSTDPLGGTQVHVVNTFPLSHSETVDHKLVIDTDYFSRMYALHSRANPKEVLVGWYSTGSELNDNSLWVQELFAGETAPASPLALLIDPASLGSGTTDLPLQAFVSAPAGAPGSDRIGSLFIKVPVDLTPSEADKSGLDLITAASESLDLNAPVTSELDSLETSLRSVHDMLESVSEYVDKVIAGEIAEPNATLGRHLLDTVSTIPRIEPDEFAKVFNSHMQDILMVLYLANLTRTQLAITERLHKMV